MLTEEEFDQVRKLDAELAKTKEALSKMTGDLFELSRDAERVARQQGINHTQAMYAQAVVDTCSYIQGHGERPVTRVQ